MKMIGARHLPYERGKLSGKACRAFRFNGERFFPDTSGSERPPPTGAKHFLRKLRYARHREPRPLVSPSTGGPCRNRSDSYAPPCIQRIALYESAWASYVKSIKTCLCRSPSESAENRRQERTAEKPKKSKETTGNGRESSSYTGISAAKRSGKPAKLLKTVETVGTTKAGRKAAYPCRKRRRQRISA